ncbi:IclR family KdgR transcriptional regulator [Streptomyces xiamenensis]|uniref:IclR family KdgR transcriptional regulator n=1 Tax=Streptomyces xiamenensis TaxID=408015 RepID=A0A0F7FU28_9ACTN|nr:IclR family transcriptional regulator [Streptomyces xiamenensis]AKG43805.1 IclR family KdgR transcriptional regulator [Streptomyces xiamenensis]
MSTSESSAVPADVVGRAIRLLVLVGEHPHGITLSELSRASGVPVSTAHRLVNSLAREGLVDFEASGKRYKPGLRLFQLGQQAGQAYGFAGTALPVMRRVTERTEEATLMSVLDGNRHLYVHYVDGPLPVGVRSEPGRHGPLHCTSMGKVLMAFAPEEVREDLLERVELTPYGPHSITDRDVLRAEVARAAAQGYATADEEHHAGLRAVAVPILRPDGSLFACLSTAAPAFRRSLDDLVALVPVLREAATELGVRLPAR